jgi:hypothetical protein
MGHDLTVLPRDVAGTVALAGVDAMLTGRELEDGRRRAIAPGRGYGDWTVDHTGWAVPLLSPEEQTPYGKTLEEALVWRLVWPMAPEIGVGSFLA